MDALQKSLLEGDDAKQKVQVPREVHGILTVHIKTIQLKDMEVDSCMLKLLSLNVTLCNNTKSFTFQQSNSTDSALCDSIKQWSVKLPEDCSSHGNTVLLELVTISPLLPHTITTLSNATIHLHDIIHTSPQSAKCELTDVDTQSAFGAVFADWAFCYGNFGYGESFQLKHCLHKAPHYLHYCLFPRLTPPSSRADHKGLVQNPHPTKHPLFIPFNQPVKLCMQASEEALVNTPHYTPQLLVARMPRLRVLCQQLQTMVDRKERLKFLEEQLTTRERTPCTVPTIPGLH